MAADLLNKCFVCLLDLQARHEATSFGHRVFCDRCGEYEITGSLAEVLINQIAPVWAPAGYLTGKWKRERFLFSHLLHRMRRGDVSPRVQSYTYESFKENPPSVPLPAEHLDNLLLFIAEKSDQPGLTVGVTEHLDVTRIGAVEEQSVGFALRSGQEQGLITLPDPEAIERTWHWVVGLTFAGWQRVQRLKEGAPSGTVAFMAMRFGKSDLDTMYSGVFRPAVNQTGFELRNLAEYRKAGSLIDLMRVEIRGARFVIADLTHRNPGAYWEAGLADGLQKPVIYVCRKDRFAYVRHFDISPHRTIPWEPNDPQGQAARDLKACIRATIPEARQQD